MTVKISPTYLWNRSTRLWQGGTWAERIIFMLSLGATVAMILVNTPLATQWLPPLSLMEQAVSVSFGVICLMLTAAIVLDVRDLQKST